MDEASTRRRAALCSAEALSASCTLTLPLWAGLRFLSRKWKFSNFAINFLRSFYPHRPITHKTAEHLWLILVAWLLLSSLKIIWRALNATAFILGSANCIFGWTRNVIDYWFQTNVHVLSLVGTMSVPSFSWRLFSEWSHLQGWCPDTCCGKDHTAVLTCA